MNFRNIIRHEECWPILNKAEYLNGAEPIIAAYERPDEFVASHILEVVTQKYNQVVAEIGLPNVMNLFAGKKALPAFLAFSQTCTGKVTALGPIPKSIIKLDIGHFGDIQAHQGVFDKINSALHDCSQ